MRTIPLGKTGLAVPAVALGCMRLTAEPNPPKRPFPPHAREGPFSD